MPNEESVCALRPIYILVVFWGEENRNYFATMLLPSLLAPGNLAAISDIAGSKLVICTTREDWDAVQGLPLFREMEKNVEPLHIEITFPDSTANKYRHNALALKLAVQRCWRDRANVSFLAPDLILSDGTFAHLRSLAERGIEAVLAPALRFNMEPCLDELTADGVYAPNRPIAVSGQRLSAIAVKNLHSEFDGFEWDSANFCRLPISVWWRLRDSKGLLVHTTSWAMMLVNFAALSNLQYESLDQKTHDDVFIFENFFRFRENNKLHLVTDSNDLFLFPLTSVTQTFLPVRSLWMNRLPLFGSLIKFWGLQLFMGSRTFDPFRRWAVTFPTFIHTTALSDSDRSQAAATTILMREATVPPGCVLRFYEELPTWLLLRSYILILIQNPALFWNKLWGRVSGRRQG